MIQLRPATIADLPILKHWDEQPHVIESDTNDDWDWETESPTNKIYPSALFQALSNATIIFSTS